MTFLPAKVRLALLLSAAALLSGAPSAHAADTMQTLVFVRHGEKPAKGLGQLDCQGLNRALALPAVLKKQFGVPDAIYAPDPSEQVDDHGVRYDYVRPLATIEPTAIAFGLPVNASIGVSHTTKLRKALEQPKYHNALVFIAWEHKAIERMTRAMLDELGADAAAVPKWKASDFDSIYVIRIARANGKRTATFTHQQQGLNGQTTSCP